MKLTKDTRQVWASVNLANHIVDFEVIVREGNLYTLTLKGYVKLERYVECNLLEIEFWSVGSRCALPPLRLSPNEQDA